MSFIKHPFCNFIHQQAVSYILRMLVRSGVIYDAFLGKICKNIAKSLEDTGCFLIFVKFKR